MGRQLRRGTDEVALTELEASVLRYLAQRPGQTVSRDALLRDVWDYADGVNSRAVTHLMARLRKKLGDASDRLVTVYGSGFRLALEDIGDLIGRTALLAQIVTELQLHRYLTLHGVAGVGKSRLAREVSQRHEHLHWISAVQLHTRDDLFVEIASALGLEPAAYTAAALGRALAAAGPCLVVLDAVENLDEFAPDTFAGWVAQAPQLLLLTTSRVLHGQERRILVPPLEPEAAARLFLRRADVVVPDRALPAESVSDIVGAVDGLPLAVELAAGRLRVLQLGELREAMASDIRILGGGSKSLSGVLQASWDALTEEQQALLSAASLFPGPFTTKMLGPVAQTGTVTLLDGLDALARAALVVERPPVFRLLDVVRTFAGEHTTNEQNAAFAEWAAERATEARTLLDTDASAGAARLIEEWQIYAAALGHAQDSSRVAALALALWEHGRMFGSPAHARPYLEALELDSLPASVRIDVLQTRWWMLTVAHQKRASLQLAKDALALARAEGTPAQIAQSWVRVVADRLILEGVEAVEEQGGALVDYVDSVDLPASIRARALTCRADIATRSQDYPTAISTLKEVVTMEGGSADSLAQGHGMLVMAHILACEPQWALAVAKTAYAKANESSVASAILRTGGALGAAALEMRRPPLVIEVYTTILPLAQELGNLLVIDQIEVVLAQLDADEESQWTRLKTVQERAAGKRPLVEGWASMELGFRCHRAGDIATSLEHYERAADALVPTNWGMHRTAALCWLALATAENGQREDARALLDRTGAKAGLPRLLTQVTSEAIEGRGSGGYAVGANSGRMLLRTVELARRSLQI